MKPKIHFLTKGLVILLVLYAQQLPSSAQGTAFTYQGRLNDGASPANGIYDMRFTIYDSSGGPGVVAGPMTNSPIAVSNGLFTVTLDFGAGVFTGGERWLQIGVRPSGSGAFTTLAPRQALLPAPYASWAANASQAVTVSGTVPSSGLDGAYSNPVSFNNPANGFAGDGGGLNNVNAAQLGGRAAAHFWQTGGNTGTSPGADFLGTSDNQALEFKVSGQRALRLEPNTNWAPNLIAGSPFNHASNTVVGATISGGGGILAAGDAYTNRVTAPFGTVGGGAGNTAAGNVATVGGGTWNTASGMTAAVGGGYANSASGQAATISGGNGNSAAGAIASVGGGFINQALGNRSTVSGGERNTASGTYATGGGGYSNTANSLAATVAGGAGNTASNTWAMVGGGDSNTAGGDRSTVGGGLLNLARGGASFVGGGERNTASGTHSSVPGGYLNEATGRFSFAAGRQAKAFHDGSFVWADAHAADFSSSASNQFAVRASGGMFLDGRLGIGLRAPSVQLDIEAEQAVARFSTVNNLNGSVLILRNITDLGPTSGYLGAINFESFLGTPGQIGYLATDVMTFRVGDFERMTLDASGLTVNGQPVLLSPAPGQPLVFNPDFASAWRLVPNGTSPNILGGYSGNTVSNGVIGAFIGGGGDLNFPNRVGGNYGAVLGGLGNTAGGEYSTAMGIGATASGEFSTAMGWITRASGLVSTAMGYRARALHNGSFVWADQQEAYFDSTAANQFSLRASGGVRLNNDTSLSFGNQTRQMINLWNTQYAIGVQANAAYFRTDNEFLWYHGGSHSDTFGDPGSGGSQIMRLGNTGNLVIAGTLSQGSDRNIKQDFAAVDGREVLEKVAALPIQSWSYTNQPGVKHLGPTAQDFHAAFGLGEDDRHIATVDTDGVALAAIQGLNQRLEQKETEIAKLKQRVERLEQLLIRKLNGGGQ